MIVMEKEPQVKIPLHTWVDICRYFTTPNIDEIELRNIENRILDTIRDKKEANDRRLLYSAKLMSEKSFRK